MIDTYFSSVNKEALDAICSGYLNVIGPQKGRAATEEYTDEGGDIVPAKPAAGDPEKWYACIRHTKEIAAPENIEVCDKEENEAVLGVWA